MGDRERDVFPRRIRAVSVSVLDPIGMRLKEKCDRAERDDDELEAAL
jgi:hypothetical protein